MTNRFKSSLRFALISIFLVGSLILLTYFNASKPRILILQALSKESSWSKAMDEGLSRPLLYNRLPVTVTREYLNLDILSDGADTKALAETMRRKIEQFDPHIVIAVDDETNDLVARHYIDKTRPQIIYTGLMHSPSRYGYSDQASVWGIREQIPVHGIATLLNEVFLAGGVRIAAVGVADLTGSAEMAHITQHDWGRNQLVAHRLVTNFEAWKSFVIEVGQHADVLLVLSVDKIPAVANSKRMAPEAEVINWTEQNSKAWPIGVRASYVRMGGGIAISSPPSQMGAMAMELALARLSQAQFMPTTQSQTTSSYDIGVRRSALARRGINVSPIYIESARSGGHLFP